MDNTVIQNSDLNNAIDNTKISLEERLSYDKLSFYYLSLPIMLIGNILAAFLLAALQISVVDLFSIGIWLLVSFIMFLYRFYHYFLFRKETEENKLRDANIWLDRYYSNALLSGIVWGSAAFLMFPETGLLNQMLVLLFLFAMGFSTMGILASKSDLLLTYVLGTYSPLLLRLFFMEDEFYTIIAYVLLSLMLIMILTANYYGKVINNSLQNRQQFMTIKHTHDKLKERFFSLFERAPVGIYYYNKDFELLDVNEHYMQMNKVETKTDLLNKKPHSLNFDKILQEHQKVFNGETGSYRGPYEIDDMSDNLYVTLSTVPMMDSDGHIGGGITIINDLTNEVKAKDEMMKNAYYDMLTNIPNRTLLMDKLKTFIADKQGQEEYAALLFMDIDNFKKVNENYGHDVGDNLLKQVVSRLQNIVSSKEIFARVSGNKFVILIPSLDIDEAKSKKITEKYIANINNRFVQPLNAAGEEYHLSFTIGVILFNDNDASAFDLLKRAETAMYEAKKNARGTSMFYRTDMTSSSREDLMLENDIHKAIQNNELSLYYQPQLDVATNKIIGAEALVRWRHPTQGFIPPSRFIPIAEESGIIIKLEEWIFDRALQEIRKLSELPGGFPLDHIAINISTMHFLQSHFVEKLMLLIQKYKLKPEWIDIEITESGIMRNINDAVEKIKELQAYGFTFSIDDFGTGYSSFAYLKELPVNVIKIDQSFVMNMHNDHGDATIVETVIAIGQKFHLKVLSEGVENQETLSHLSQMGCDLYQGNYLYKAMPFESFTELLTDTQV